MLLIARRFQGNLAGETELSVKRIPCGVCSKVLISLRVFRRLARDTLEKERRTIYGKQEYPNVRSSVVQLSPRNGQRVL
jgi:hypothetical protein